MTIQKLLAPLRKAVNDYNLIESGDKVAVGVSGGKDSISLLALLDAFRKFSDRPFELMGITVDMGFNKVSYAPVEEYCSARNIPYKIIKTDIAEIIFDVRKEQSPCSLCSKMRRGALNSEIAQEGYNKLALGHHRDDLVETFLMSLLHEGRLSALAPKSYMSRSGITLIRPLIYIPEKDLASLAENLPVVFNPCPADKHTEREKMKELLKSLSESYPKVTERFANALTHPERYNLWDNVNEKYEAEKNKPDADDKS